MERDSMLPVHLNVRDLDEAWYVALKYCFMFGHEWTVNSGSYTGQKRHEFDSFSCFIKNPGKGPLVPLMPEGSGLTPPTSKEYVESYFATYLMSDAKSKNEDYTYGERIVNPMYRQVKRANRKDQAEVKDGPLMEVNQVDEIVKELIHSKGNSNQTCIEIAMPNDVLLNDPPCLRLIDVRARHEKLHFFVYFRSWDLYSGFPANLGGIEMVKQYMVSELNDKGLKIQNGSLFAFSKGLHIYDMYYPLVESRFGKTKQELEKEGSKILEKAEKNLESCIVYNG